MYVKNKIIAFILFFIMPFVMVSAEDFEGNTYRTEHRLFHISRSVNKNLVCYDANLKGGKLDNEHPLKVYWVNREEHPGEIGELNYIQRKMAYGYKKISGDQEECICSLTAYSARKLTVTRQGDEYVCLITINNLPSILHSLYVKASPRNPLSVEYVELRGVSLSDGQPVTERVKK